MIPKLNQTALNRLFMGTGQMRFGTVVELNSNQVTVHKDGISGEQIVAVFTPFLLALPEQDLSRKTRNLHRDNLWLRR